MAWNEDVVFGGEPSGRVIDPDPLELKFLDETKPRHRTSPVRSNAIANYMCPDIVFYGKDDRPIVIIRTTTNTIEIPEGVDTTEAARGFIDALRTFGVNLLRK